jgi:hypothetical protein
VALTGCKGEFANEVIPAREMLRVLDGTIEIQSDVEETIVNVTADCHWKVDSLDSGDFGSNLTIRPREGVGDGVLVIGNDQNTTNADRTALIVLVSDGGLRQKVTIRQTGKGDGINLSRGSFNFETEPSEAQFLTISSNTHWRIEIPEGVNWITLDQTSGESGETSIQVKAAPSSTDALRSTSLSVLYGDAYDKVEEFTVSQKGLTSIYLETDESVSSFESTGGETVIHVESNAQWFAFIPSSISWLHFDSELDSLTSEGTASRIGSGDLHIKCDENSTSRDRTTGVVIVAGSRSPKEVVVTMEQIRDGSILPLETSVGLSELSVSYDMANFIINVVSEEVVGDYGLVYSTNAHPTITEGQKIVAGNGGLTSAKAYKLEGLKDNTTYYVRAFVEKKSTQETLYSDELTVTTLAYSAMIGEVRSLYVGDTYADMRFSYVADEEIIDCGFVYSGTNETPTRENDTMVTIGHSGMGGNVMTTIADLEKTTTYYIRGYLLTKQGIIYSPNVVTITTSKTSKEPGESSNPDPIFSRKM